MPASPDSATVYVAGEWRAASDRFPVTDPANGEPLGHAAEATDEDVELALAAAAEAAPHWADTPAEERAGLLRDVAARIRAQSADLAETLTRENGKPLVEARGELTATARTLEWVAEEARRAYGRVVPLEAHRRGMAWVAPIGVSVGIAPWNFPASMLVRKIALALGAGCPMIAKPAEQTPLVAARLTGLFHDAGLPPGVLALLTTSRPAALVDRLLADPVVAKVSFTGSTEVGRELHARQGGRLKSVSLELGGHAPGIVFADADLDFAVEAVVASKFRNAGQSCTALNRLYLHDAIADEFVERLRGRVTSLRLGPGLDERTDVGPLIDQAAVTRLQDQLDDAVAAGATILTGGGPDFEGRLAKGCFFAPTLVTEVARDARLFREEIFGPVLPISRFADPDAAIAAANDTDYGLAGYLYGRDLNELWRAAERLSFGVVGINDPFPVAPELPFGGNRNSGVGREGGSEGLAAYLSTKSVTVGLGPTDGRRP